MPPEKAVTSVHHNIMAMFMAHNLSIKGSVYIDYFISCCEDSLGSHDSSFFRKEGWNLALIVNNHVVA